MSCKIIWSQTCFKPAAYRSWFTDLAIACWVHHITEVSKIWPLSQIPLCHPWILNWLHALHVACGASSSAHSTQCTGLVPVHALQGMGTGSGMCITCSTYVAQCHGAHSRSALHTGSRVGASTWITGPLIWSMDQPCTSYLACWAWWVRHPCHITLNDFVTTFPRYLTQMK